MQEKSVYLDTSSLVKRYIGEMGSEVVDRVYDEAEAGKMKISFSIWNIGEAVGVFDRYLVRGLISDVEFKRARADIVSESLKMSKLEALSLFPITYSVLAASWSLVPKHHIYVADALQISSSREAGCDMFLGADKRLLDAASVEGIKVLNIESNPEEALRGIA